MSWFQKSGIAHIAKNALSSAQKTIDRALDIHGEEAASALTFVPEDDPENFFAAFGLVGGSPQSKVTDASVNRVVALSSDEQKPSNANQKSIWGSFSGSFFEPKNPVETPSNTNESKESQKSQSDDANLVSNVETGPTETNFQMVHVDQDLEVPEPAESAANDEPKLESELESLASVTAEVTTSSCDVIVQQPVIGKQEAATENVAGSDSCVVGESGCEPLVSWSETSTDETGPSLNLLELSELDGKDECESSNRLSFEMETDSCSDLTGSLRLEESTKSTASEASLGELLDKSTDSNETIKDNVCEETLQEGGVREDLDAAVDSKQNLSHMWDWESKLLSFSSNSSVNDDSSLKSSAAVTTEPKMSQHRENFSICEVSLEGAAMGESAAADTRPPQTFEESFVNLSEMAEEKNTSVTSSILVSLDEFPDSSTQLLTKDASKEAKSQPLEKSAVAPDCSSVKKEDESADLRDSEAKLTDSATSVSSSASSFVKCMIEEAMVDQENHRCQSPHSTTSSSEKSDVLKLGSEQNSGHTSGDEVETTTSSDIEIISMSSANGESLERLTLSPIKQIWVGKPSRLKRGDRSDSPASDSSNFRDSPMASRSRSETKLVTTSITSKNSGNYLARCQGERKHLPGRSENESQAEIDVLGKKLAEMTEILHARENKLVELSRENVGLQETNNSIRKQLHQSEEAHAADKRDVTSLTEELSQRLATMERNLQQALKEKEFYLKEFQMVKEESANKICAKEVGTLIQERDAQIQGLMQEGEKLSKQQLQHNNIIKKLRAKEKENEILIKQQKEKLEEQANELERTRKVLSKKEDIECKQIDAIRRLTNTDQKQEKEIAMLKSDLEDAQEKMKSMKSVLDASYKELAELHRSNVAKESQVQEVALSAEIAAKEELRLALEKVKQNSHLEQESFMGQIEDLRIALTRSEQQSNRREDVLRQEFNDLQQRLEEAEHRNQELTQAVSAATRPLLRQIENLQATFSSQSTSWEKLEKNLTDRLNEAQTRLSSTMEKERSATEKYMEVSSRLSSLEAQNNLLHQEKTRLQTELETKKTKLEMLEEWKTKESIQIEMLKQSFADEMTESKRQQRVLENQLEIEKTVVEAEKRKNSLLQDQAKEREKRNSQIITESSNRTTPSPTLSLSKFSSVSESFNPWIQDDNLEQNIMISSTNSNRLNLYDTLRHNGATSFLEGLQSQLKMKEGEILQLQNEISQLEKIRESMAQELIRLSTRNEDLETEFKELQEKHSKFQDMEQKYNALLQMYGEKIEEADELRLDLQDVKDMYKAQINELLKKK